MQLTPYLTFDGHCREAFAFYRQLLGGEVTMALTYGETPMADQIPAEARARIAHARLVAGDMELMGADAFPSAEQGCGGYQKPQGTRLTLRFDDVGAAHRLFDALADGGTITMAFERTFFAEGFGMATDRFGTPWMVICEGAA